MNAKQQIKIEIETYLMHPNELLEVAKQINEMTEKGIFDYSGEKFSFKTLVLNEPEYRIEIINDQVHTIFPSKMNRK